MSEIADVAVDAEDVLSTSEAGPAAIRGAALRTGSFIGGTLISTVAAALLFRHLGTVETGRYATAISLSAIVTGFTDLGLTAIGMREYSVLEGSVRDRVARNLLGIRIVLTVIGVFVTAGFAYLAYGQLLGTAVLIAGAGVLIQNTQTTLSVPLMAGLRFGWISSLDLTRQIIMSILIVLLVVAGAQLLPFVATAGVAAAVVLIPTILLVRDMIPIAPSFDRREWRAMMAPIITYSAAAAAGVLYFRIAIVLVSLIATDHELGYYGLSFRIVEVLFAIPATVVGAAFPIFARAARDDPARLGYALGRVFEVALIAGVWLSLSIAVGASFAVKVVGGPEFAPAVPILAVQGLAVGATFVGAAWAYAMLSLRLHRLILIFNLSMLALVAALVAALTALDGAQGAAIGTAAAEIIAAIVGGLLLIRPRPYLKPSFRVVPKVVLATALAASPVLLSGLPVVGRVVISTIIYSIVLVLTKALPTELRVLLPARLRGAL